MESIIQTQNEVIEQYRLTLAAHQDAHQKMLEYIKSIYELLISDIPGAQKLAITHLGKVAEKAQQVTN